MDEKQKNSKMQFAYLLPNLFTAASAFLGVASIIASVDGKFEKAALYIMLSLIFDGLDGRVARLTKTTSKFGVEFDSLADVIAFGAAPAMFFYFHTGIEFGRIGVIIAAIFVVFGAIRLARFNIMSPVNEPSVFIGIPIPTAAVLVVMWGLMFEKYPQILSGFEWTLLVLQTVTAFLMVSNIRYPSFKKINLKKSSILKVLTSLIVIASMIYLYPIQIFTILATAYVLYGLIRVSVNFFIAKIKKNKYNN
ncbi:MAG: CDP-diacylglycerol--serine O-phosphatidyltransferase [Campylobacteraceae bacterium]|jgi:CDP-diacylglycerol--serine O-phosphatidyltransferase|nr:CDP-diacylglycerol--serine O-phosphatidyltransferase [Campylobacteraceae bacterium]